LLVLVALVLLLQLLELTAGRLHTEDSMPRVVEQVARPLLPYPPETVLVLVVMGIRPQLEPLLVLLDRRWGIKSVVLEALLSPLLLLPVAALETLLLSLVVEVGGHSRLELRRLRQAALVLVVGRQSSP
jgi:hypothetical protein